MAFRVLVSRLRSPLGACLVGSLLAYSTGCSDSNGPPPTLVRVPDDVVDDLVIVVPDVPDVTDVTDASDADVTDASDADVTDASDADVTDASDASDASDAADADAFSCDASVCDASCVDLMNDLRNCGSCGNVCSSTLPNTVPVCVAGRCNATLTCAPGFSDCDGMMANGCEVATGTNAENCGRCGNVCPASLNATAACVAGACVTVCGTGFGNCDGSATNGCEVDLRRTPTHCGACGRVCTIGTENVNSSPSCVDGACTLVCNTGFGDCNGNRGDGCEINTQTNARNCGGCGTSCDAPNAAGVCTAGRCSFVCNAGFGDCDGVTSNGCEVDLNLSTANCGRCGNACVGATNAAPACTRGSCTLACTGTFGDCNGIRADGCEVETANATENCGRCGNVCPGYANGTPTCTGGTCRPACAMGYGNCDGDNSDGCETDVRITPAHCGVCGRVCPTGANAITTCAGSTCGILCLSGFADCDANPANGCEVNLNTTATSCGMCGRACSLAHATPGCTRGACSIAACESGFSDCDGVDSNGCETTGMCPSDAGAGDDASDSGPVPT